MKVLVWVQRMEPDDRDKRSSKVALVTGIPPAFRWSEQSAMDTRVKSHAEQHCETPRVIPTRFRREITASTQGTKGGIMGAFLQI